MEYLHDIFLVPGVSQSLLILTIVVALGIFLAGRLTIRGMGLGVTWILFCGILFSALGIQIDPTVEQFAKDFGLVLFVYSLGLQAGPSFFSSFSHGGLRLNLLATAIVVLGVGGTLAIAFISHEDMASMVGVMTGAVTNTSSMGAAQQAYADLHHTAHPYIATCYALAYPFSVLGVIVSMVLLQKICRIRPQEEEKALLAEAEQQSQQPVCVDIRLTNTEILNKRLTVLHNSCKAEMVVSRIIHSDGQDEVAHSKTVLREGDTIRVLTDHAHLQELQTLGEVSVFKTIPNGDTPHLVSRRIVVTKPEWNGQKIGKVSLRAHYNVNITRVIRAGVGLLATPMLRLQLGDRIIVVGEQDDVRKVGELFGNELKRLDAPNLIPIFVGIALGVIVGTLPIALPGLGQSFRLGLAGGTLVVALLMGRFGPTYKIVTFSTTSANHMLREVGLALFLAAVGLGAGEVFLSALTSGGYMWIVYSILIAVLPLLIVGIIAYRAMHINYFTVIGLFTGAMNDAPALGYAMSISPNNDQASVTYATVYPLTMFLRILAAQLMIILLC